MYIENVLAQAESKAETAAPQVEESEASIEAPAETTETTQQPETGEETNLETKPDSELTPEQLAKREANRQSHKNSREAKERRERQELKRSLHAMQQQLEQMRQTTANPYQAQAQQMNASGEPQAPNPDNFNTWEELDAANKAYIKEYTKWQVKQALGAQEPAPQQQQPQVSPEVVQRSMYHQQVEAEVAKQIPDFQQVVSEYLAAPLSENVKQALFEAENASLAFYTLAKEGTLDDLEFMSPTQIAREIGRAEIRGQSYLSANRVSKAPPPMRSATGISTAKKQTPQELLQSFKKGY